MSFRFSAAVATVVLILACLALPLRAAIVYQESLSGDLSNNRNAHTLVTVAPADNDIIGVSGFGDTEYFRIDIPALFRLTNVRVAGYTGVDSTSFIGVQRGTTFTVDPGPAQ